MSTPVPRMGSTDWGLLLALSLLWGGSFLFVAVAVAEVPPLTLVALRVSIAGAAMLIVARLLGLPWPWMAAPAGAFLLLGLLNNAIPFTLLFYGQTRITAGLASILNATTPIFTVLVLHWLTTDERLTRPKAIGVGLGFAGVVVLVGPDALAGIGGDVLAQVACLGATLSYGFALYVARRFKGVPPVAVAAGQLTASTLMMVPLALVVDQPWTLPVPSMPTIGAVLALALASTALAYAIYFRVAARAGGTNASLVTFLIPTSAIALGALVLGEGIAPLDMVGLGLILAGLVVIDGRMFRRAV